MTNPRVLMVGRTRYGLPLEGGIATKFDALGEVLDLRVLASPDAPAATRRDERFRLLTPVRPAVLDGAGFYARLPIEIAREIRAFRPDAIIAESPPIGAAALSARALAREPGLALRQENVYRSRTGSPSCSTTFAGSLMVKVDPTPGSLSTVTLPPII